MEIQKFLKLGNNGYPDVFRGSEKRRFGDKSLVDQYLSLGIYLKRTNFCYQILKFKTNCLSKLCYKLKTKKIKNKLSLLNSWKKKIICLGKKLTRVQNIKDTLENFVGNLVHSTCFFHEKEILTRIGYLSFPKKKKNVFNPVLNHVELLKMIGGVDYKRGSSVSGNRGYFLKGPGLLLNLSLLRYGLDFLSKKNYISLQTPLFMNTDLLKKCTQLEDFKEQLYPIGDNQEKFLIATSEQPISAFHFGEKITAKNLPLKYSGISTCFRRESGSHGKDTAGIFRVHQFEKIEQFILSHTKGLDSLILFEELLRNTREFYSSLKIPFSCIDIPSGAINHTAAKKTDLLGWFPASRSFKELVSCSNCTDFQSRKMNIEIFGIQKKFSDKFPHMLNSTLCATTRVICCILENYQTRIGIKIPDILRSYTGITFFPFENFI
mmetsp:Transcript_24061/g.48590  ORF Transcript_24061/g.48590 Transcript_24061/m.48590 type:complete len:435 (-) Transcript_24061:3177-4481(-)